MNVQPSNIVPLPVPSREPSMSEPATVTEFAGLKRGETVFSQDRKFRYTLWRSWNTHLLMGLGDGPKTNQKPARDFVQFIGLNPSTADETLDDPTIRRCINFSKEWGYGSMCMTNLFAFRATDPKDMKRCRGEASPVGSANNAWLIQVSMEASLIICCWGRDGTHMNRQAEVLGILPLEKVKCFGGNGDGTPKHPLYLPGNQALIEWRAK